MSINVRPAVKYPLTPSITAAAAPVIPPPFSSYAAFMLLSFSLTVSLAACKTVPAVFLIPSHAPAAVLCMFPHTSTALSFIAVSFPPVAVSIALKAPVTMPLRALSGAIAIEPSTLKVP